MTEPSPCFTVGTKQSPLYRFSDLRTTLARPSSWERKKRDLSEKMSIFHSSPHAWCSLHHASLALTVFLLRSGFLQAVRLSNPALATYLRMVVSHRLVLRLALTSS